MECPERICSKCQVGHAVAVTANEGTSYYACSNCKSEFVGNPCTAGEKEDWEKKFDKLSDGQGLHYVCDGKTCNCDDIVKSFIKELLKSEKEKWQKERSGWNELKQCPQCFTMKVFTTKVCYRCTDRNDIREELINKLKE